MQRIMKSVSYSLAIVFVLVIVVSATSRLINRWLDYVERFPEPVAMSLFFSPLVLVVLVGLCVLLYNTAFAPQSQDETATPSVQPETE